MHLNSSFRWVPLLGIISVLPACRGTFLSATLPAHDDDPSSDQDAVASIVQIYTGDSSDEMPDFLQESSPHYRMVAFHDDSDDTHHCSTCPSNTSSDDSPISPPSFMDEYTTLAQRLLQYTTLLNVHSISCSQYPSLCSAGTYQHIDRTPIVRLYTPHQPHGSPLLLPHQFHPYKILDTLGLLPDSTMVRPFLDDQTYFGGNDGDAEQDGDFLRELEQVYRVKRGLLEHDMQFAFERWLRHFVVTPHTTLVVGGSNDGTSRLRPAVVDTLRDTLEWLRMVLAEVPGGTRLGPLVADVRNNIGYITRDTTTDGGGTYLQNILDEHTVRDWSAVCQSTQDGGSSYLCGVWKLLFRWAIGVREYTEAAVRPVVLPSMQQAMGRIQTEMGLLCAVQDQDCIGLVMEDIAAATREANKEESYESQVLWLAELRQKMQRFLRKRQKKMLTLPYTAEDDVVTQWPLRSHCPRCWMKDGETRNLTVTYAFIELEFGRSVLWKDVLPAYDIVYPEEDGDSDLDAEDNQEVLSS